LFSKSDFIALLSAQLLIGYTGEIVGLQRFAVL